MRRGKVIFILWCLLVLAALRTTIPAIPRFAAEVFVAADGSDTGDGSAGCPVASLTRARDLVRQLARQGPGGPILVNVLPGEYRVLPVHGEMMYFPEVWGRSGGEVFTVTK